MKFSFIECYIETFSKYMITNKKHFQYIVVELINIANILTMLFLKGSKSTVSLIHLFI